MSESAFKQLYSQMINSGGNLAAVQNNFKDSAGKVKKIKCFVKEAFPYFLVTDNFFYVPCYFTKKAYDGFRAAHSGVNITDLKSKIIEIGEWSLEMRTVDSSSVFTSYAGIEIALVVSSFKLVQGTNKMNLSQYPSNLYRDDEMKTLFQAYHHTCLQGKLPARDSLPDTNKKADSNTISLGSGNAFAYGFKHFTSACVPMNTIAKLEKGQNFLQALKSSGSNARPTVQGGAKASKKASKTPKKAGGVTKTIVKASVTNNQKQSVKKIGSKVPGVGTPGQGNSKKNTPANSKATIARMKQFIKNKGNKK